MPQKPIKGRKPNKEVGGGAPKAARKKPQANIKKAAVPRGAMKLANRDVGGGAPVNPGLEAAPPNRNVGCGAP